MKDLIQLIKDHGKKRDSIWVFLGGMFCGLTVIKHDSTLAMGFAAFYFLAYVQVLLARMNAQSMQVMIKSVDEIAEITIKHMIPTDHVSRN